MHNMPILLTYYFLAPQWMSDDTYFVVLFDLWWLIILMLQFFYGSGRWYPFGYVHKRNEIMISGEGKAKQCMLFLYFEEHVLALWLKMPDVDVVLWPTTNNSSIFFLHRTALIHMWPALCLGYSPQYYHSVFFFTFLFKWSLLFFLHCLDLWNSIFVC